jgi:hypothetical protein
MGALLTLPVSLLNLFLPFTKPGTPLAQDLIHTAVLCGTLYYAPRIAEWYNTRKHHTVSPGDDLIDQPGTEHEYVEHNIPRPADPPLDERLVLQPSDEDSDPDTPHPPPLAPTPPNFAQQPPLPQDADAGPANPGPRATTANRTIGAKKAKSLARKDQRRAYHEFHRQEAELRRLQEQEGAEERQKEISAEKERRAKIEADIASKEREERATRKEAERKEVEEENERRQRVVGKVRDAVQRKGCVDLLDEARREKKDKAWVVKLVKASGLLAQLSCEGSKTMITGDGWLVRVDEAIMEQAYRDAEAFGRRNEGRIGFEDMGGFIERSVRARAKA